MRDDDAVENLEFYKRLAKFREESRDSAWELLIALGIIGRDEAIELREMIDSDPAEFRSAMKKLAKDCDVLRHLKEYLPFSNNDVQLTDTGRHDMAVMIAEAIATREQVDWKPLEKHPRVSRRRTANRR